MKVTPITDLGKPIAHGRTSAIYLWPDGRVLQLFLNSIFSTTIPDLSLCFGSLSEL
jgi:hypothetical protein